MKPEESGTGCPTQSGTHSVRNVALAAARRYLGLETPPD